MYWRGSLVCKKQFIRLEEKRQRLLALETQRNQQNKQQDNQALIDNESLNDN
jgi:hypothetical protein